ncbi:MAG: type II toxin-antitoxin system PemK/MazF family toxin [Streptosporangiaceae bacterium]
MQDTIGFDRGDIVLVAFVFADERGVKRRPALILSCQAYHRRRDEAILAAITSNTQRLFFGDTLVEAWANAGLLFPSVVTGVVRTIKREMILRRLGALSPLEMHAVERRLRLSLAL